MRRDGPGRAPPRAGTPSRRPVSTGIDGPTDDFACHARIRVNPDLGQQEQKRQVKLKTHWFFLWP
jgi:hypothetical protein